MSPMYSFLTHFACARLHRMWALVGAYERLSSSQTWKKKSDLPNFFLTSAAQTNMQAIFNYSGGFETAFLVKCGNKDLPQVAKERQKTKRQGRKTGGGEGGSGGGGWTEAKEYIATHVSTYQLISSKFLSGLKHSPKVDCGKHKTNKTVRNSGKEPEWRHMMSYGDDSKGKHSVGYSVKILYLSKSCNITCKMIKSYAFYITMNRAAC